MTEQTLYIIMRNDMDSLNPGKAMAQANHAYGAFKKAIRSHLKLRPAYTEWGEQTEQEFGRTIVLEGNESTIQAVLDIAANDTSNIVCGWIHDPTYPVVDGDVIHHIPVNTCAFVFGDVELVKGLVSHLELAK